MPVWVKDPDDVEDYTLDWSQRLVEDDFLVGVVFTVSSSELNLVSSNFTNTVSTCWLSGGVPGGAYEVNCHVTTDAGRQHERTFRIQLGNK